MKHLFIPYELAVIAKEKGFNEECILVYYKKNLITIKSHLSSLLLPVSKNSECPKHYHAAPLYQQIIDWFREKYKIQINIESFVNGFFFKISYEQFKSLKSSTKDHYTYYEALNAAITEAFKLI